MAQLSASLWSSWLPLHSMLSPPPSNEVQPSRGQDVFSSPTPTKDLKYLKRLYVSPQTLDNIQMWFRQDFSSYQSQHPKTKSRIQLRKSVMTVLKTIYLFLEWTKSNWVLSPIQFSPSSKESPADLRGRHAKNIEWGSEKSRQNKCAKSTWRAPFLLMMRPMEMKVEETGWSLPSRKHKLMFPAYYFLSSGV